MTHSIVIGGSNGLGRVIAHRLLDRGDRVLITSRDTARADAVAKELGDKLARDVARLFHDYDQSESELLKAPGG